MKTDNQTPQLLLVCSQHGEQSAINMKGLQTEHLILGCGCAYQLRDEGPAYDGNTNEEPDFFEESRRCFVDAKSIPVPADVYFQRLESIHLLAPNIEDLVPINTITHTSRGSFVHTH